MYTKTILTLAFTASSLLASSLMTDAKNAGLIPIPTDKKELLKLTDNPKNPITTEKIELGKNYILILDSQKAVL